MSVRAIRPVARATVATQAGARRSGLDRRVVAFLAVLAYVPLLLTAPGKVAADTKLYLYTDPARLVARAGWLWDPNVAAGTITHQTIGYLFPMGPYYWLCQNLGIPDWLAQRVWLGSILLAAGTGAMWLLRRLGLSTSGAAIAGIVYMSSPYIVPYLGRTSVLLLPWAALPWLTGLLVDALRRGGWRAPVLFGIVLTLVGGTNASSLVFVAIGPALWVPYAVWVTKEADARRALAVLGRLAVTCIPAQLWWIAGLRMQGRYGLPILELTETVQTVAQTSTAPEIGRGMGYWYAYGRDGLSPWTPAATGYMDHLWLILTSFALPTLALVSALFVRWRHRAYFVCTLVVGMILGIGTYPYASPPPFGWLVKTAAAKSAAGLALRNTPRAVPILTLATAALIGAGTSAALHGLARVHRPSLGRPLVAGLAVLAVINLPSHLTGATVASDLSFPEDIPDYWYDATSSLDAASASSGEDTRVLELPGSDFAVYRWGETQDPLTPGLLERPWIGRELTAYGTPGTVDLLRALDRRIQEGVFDNRSVAPIARLLAAGDVLWRSDTQYERYRGPRPQAIWPEINAAPGLGEPASFGPAAPSIPDARRPMRDETELAMPADAEDPPPLATFPVDGAPDIVHATTAATPLLVSGDGESLVDAAEAGLLRPGQAVLYAATLAADPGALAAALDDGAELLVTDGNRKRAQRWGTLRDNNGFTEQADGTALVDDPKDTRIEVFPDQGVENQTVADFAGIADVEASEYGNTVGYAPDSRPVSAIDGDLRTAWQLGGFAADVVGARLRLTFDEPVTTDRINVTQLGGNRFITKLGVRLDGSKELTASLGDPSFDDAGQDIVFDGPRTFRTLEVRIDGANVENLPTYIGWSTVGLRELRVAGTTAEEVIRVPTDLLSQSDGRDLDVLLSRWRADPGEPFRSDPEPQLVRAIDLPSARSFSLAGEARLEPRAEGSRIDSFLGRPGIAGGYATAEGTDFLAASAGTRPSAAIDGDPATAWVPNLGPQTDRNFHVTLPRPTTVDHLDLALLADGWHSVPTQLTLELDGGGSVVVDVPTVADGAERGATALVPIDVPAFTTTGFRVRVTGSREVTSIEYFSGEPGPLPVGIAELGIDGVDAGPLPANLPSGCRDDLLTVDGTPASVRVTGTVADALARRPLAVAACEPLPELGPGRTVVRSADGRGTAIAIDRVLLTSDNAGNAGNAGNTGGASPAASEAPAVLDTEPAGRLGYDVHVRDATSPFWLVLGQSHSDGWEATVNGRSLGTSTLIDGYANGWRIDPADIGTSFDVALRWTPQRTVWIAVAVSAVSFIALVVAAALLVVRDRRQQGNPNDTGARDVESAPAFTVPWAAPARVSGSRAALALVAAILSWSVAGGATAVVVGTLVLVASFVPRGRLAAIALVVGAYPVTAVWYVARQWHGEYPPGVEWPDIFGFTHELVLGAVLTLAALVVLDALDARAAPPGGARPADAAAD